MTDGYVAPKPWPEYDPDTWLRDYTEVVMDLVYACESRRPKLTWHYLGNGDSRDGIDTIGYAAALWLQCVHRAEAVGYFWDGEWIEACEEYANLVTKYWRKYGMLSSNGNFESIAAKIMKKHMIPPEKS